MVKSAEIPDSAEHRIYEAAVAVFLEKGYDGARMQEIADLAGINKSLLHYYYRSKELLFKKVFSDTVTDMIESIYNVFLETDPFETKIKNFSHVYLDFLMQRPQMPLFLLNEIRLHPQLIAETMGDVRLKSKFLTLKSIITKSVNDKEIETDNELHLMINAISMLIFPVIARDVISLLFDLSAEDYRQLMEERKTIVPEFILQTFAKS